MIPEAGDVPERAPVDPLVCPRGHHSIEVNATRFSCETCHRQGREKSNWDRSELHDLRDGDPPLRADGGREEVVVEYIHGAGFTYFHKPGWMMDEAMDASIRVQERSAEAMSCRRCPTCWPDSDPEEVATDGGHTPAVERLLRCDGPRCEKDVAADLGVDYDRAFCSARCLYGYLASAVGRAGP